MARGTTDKIQRVPMNFSTLWISYVCHDTFEINICSIIRAVGGRLVVTEMSVEFVCWLNACQLWSFPTTQYVMICFSNDTLQQITILMQYNSDNWNYRFALANVSQYVHWKEQRCKKLSLCFTHSVTTQPELLICNKTQPPLNKGAVYDNTSLLLKLQSNTLHKRHWIVSQLRRAAPGNDLRSSGTGGQILLCLTHSLLISLPLCFT